MTILETQLQQLITKNILTMLKAERFENQLFKSLMDSTFFLFEEFSKIDKLKENDQTNEFYQKILQMFLDLCLKYTQKSISYNSQTTQFTLQNCHKEAHLLFNQILNWMMTDHISSKFTQPEFYLHTFLFCQTYLKNIKQIVLSNLSPVSDKVVSDTVQRIDEFVLFVDRIFQHKYSDLYDKSISSPLSTSTYMEMLSSYIQNHHGQTSHPFQSIFHSYFSQPYLHDIFHKKLYLSEENEKSVLSSFYQDKQHLYSHSFLLYLKSISENKITPKNLSFFVQFCDKHQISLKNYIQPFCYNTYLMKLFFDTIPHYSISVNSFPLKLHELYQFHLMNNTDTLQQNINLIQQKIIQKDFHMLNNTHHMLYEEQQNMFVKLLNFLPFLKKQPFFQKTYDNILLNLFTPSYWYQLNKEQQIFLFDVLFTDVTQILLSSTKTKRDRQKIGKFIHILYTDTTKNSTNFLNQEKYLFLIQSFPLHHINTETQLKIIHYGLSQGFTGLSQTDIEHFQEKTPQSFTDKLLTLTTLLHHQGKKVKRKI